MDIVDTYAMPVSLESAIAIYANKHYLLEKYVGTVWKYWNLTFEQL